MIVVAVLDQDVDARIRHPPRQHSQLTGNTLVQPLDQHLILRDDADPRLLQRGARSCGVTKQKMRHASAVRLEDSAAFDADPCTAEDFSHLGQGTGPVLQVDGQVFHRPIIGRWRHTA